jgi:CubicO group peptidase (beta-lactamase class C family)
MAAIVRLSQRRAPIPLASLALAILVGIGAVARAQEPAAGDVAPTAEPPMLQTALPSILKDKFPTVRALVLARGDCVGSEYYRKGIGIGTRSPVHSVTKSVLSILIGIAIDRGYLRLDQKLSDFLPEASEAAVDPLVREIEVRDLLTMTAGFEAGASDYPPKISVPTSETWRWMLDRPMKYPSGSHFSYDTSEQNLMSIVLTRAIKQDAKRFAQHSLFEPLQIEDYNWPVDVDGYLIGATSLSLTARDMAKIGVLYLQQGRWGAEQIVSNAFVLDSTTKHNEGGPPTNAAYGYFWWITKTKTDLDAFFAAGSGSQLIYVVPKRDLVIALAAESVPGGSVNFVNDVVLPAEAATPGSAPCIARLTQGRPE